MGFLPGAEIPPAIVNSSVRRIQEYLTGAEVERLMVMILLAKVIRIIPGALVILLADLLWMGQIRGPYAAPWRCRRDSSSGT